MMTDDEIIEVVRARKEGKRIEVTPLLSRFDVPCDQWVPFPNDGVMGWDFTTRMYRVAKEPREWWLIAGPPKSGLHVGYPSLKDARRDEVADKDIIHVREVLP